MSWVDAIVQNLLAIIRFLSPATVVRVYQRGVVFRLGVPHRVMEPGLRWKWPFNIEVVEPVWVAEETRNLLTQSVTTSDDVAATFSVNLVFRVTDPTLYLTAIYDFDTSLDCLAMTHLAERVRRLSWAEFRDGQRDLERSLTGTLETRLKKWGAEIISVGFTDSVRARPFRFYGDPGEIAKVMRT